MKPSLAIPSLLGAFVALGAASGLHATASTTVSSGFDLLATSGGTTFMGAPFVGVPLGTFDFGPSGAYTVGNADTIVHRLSDASVVSMPGTAAPIPVEMVALQLASAVPVDFGLGLGTYYITLQSERGGPASVGTMSIGFTSEASPHGSFSSFFDIFFDIRLGGLDGPIAASDHLSLANAGAPWQHEPLSSTLIDGVNHLLNGVNILEDFWFPFVIEEHPGVGVHAVQPSGGGGDPVVPEAGSLLLGLPLGFAGWVYLRARRKTVAAIRPD